MRQLKVSMDQEKQFNFKKRNIVSNSKPMKRTVLTKFL